MNDPNILEMILSHRDVLNTIQIQQFKRSQELSEMHENFVASRSYLLLVVESGMGKVQIDQDMISLTAGSAFLASEVTRAMIIHASKSMTYYTLRFTFDDSVSFQRMSPNTYCHRSLVDGIALCSSLYLQYTFMKRKEANRSKLSVFTASIVCQIISMMQLSKEGTDIDIIMDNRINMAIDYIEINPIDGVTVSQLASICSLSPEYFSKLFKMYLGLSPKKYLLQKKMTKAKELLISEELNVKGTALVLGYSDPYVFSNQFKKTFGIAPSYYCQVN